jgi:hypothetical protein
MTESLSESKSADDHSNTVRVRQGDNVAGLLFLFLMQAMDESFKKQCALPEPEF